LATNNSSNSNIGASRLLGTQGLQQAVDSLTQQVNKLNQSIGAVSGSFNNMAGAGRRAAGGSAGGSWNAGSNRANYSNYNGGGGVFTGLGQRLSSMPGGGRIAAAGAIGAGFMSATTAYANKNMADMMVADLYGSQANIVAGRPGSTLSRHMVFSGNNIALNTMDAARAAYTNTYNYGNAYYGTQVNQRYLQGQNQQRGFAYASPGMGAQAAAQTATELGSGRAFYMSQALGLRPTIGNGGVQSSPQEIARSIYNRTFGNRQVTNKQLSASLTQTGSLSVNLNYMSSQLGLSQQSQTMMRNYLTGLTAARNSGMSTDEFDKLSTLAGNNDRAAINKLKKATGLGDSMFESQRSLNTSRADRMQDILDSLSPAFKDATAAVQNFTEGINAFLKSTGLDSAIGTAGGWGSALSGGLGGFSAGFGGIGGGMLAARLFGMFRGGGGAGGAGGMINATRGAGGAYGITSAGSSASLMSTLAPVAGAAGLSVVVGNKIANENRKLLPQYMKKDADGNPTVSPNVYHSRLMHFDGRAGGGHNSNSADGGSGGGGGNGSSSNNGATAAQVLGFAQSQLGVPYVWGGTSPGKGLDCSGLVQWAFGQAGVKLPRVSQDQENSGSPVNLGDVQPGDLLFKGHPATHVAIAMGNGQLIEAPRTGLNVRIRGYSPSEFTSARRILGSVGNMGSLINGKSGNDVKNTLNNAQSRSGGNTGDFGSTSEAAAVASALASSLGSLPMRSASAKGTSGTSPLGQEPTGGGGNDKASLQSYAKQLLAKYGWSDQWSAFDALVMSESSWDVHATNKSSGAYGLPQSLPPSKMKSAGSDWQTNGETQLRWMMDYISGRYGNPSKAWSFHQRNNWYASGAWNIDQDQAAQVHKGEMILPAKQAETVRSAITNAIANSGGKETVTTSGGLTIQNLNVNLPAGYTGSSDDARAVARSIYAAIEDRDRLVRLQKGI